MTESTHNDGEMLPVKALFSYNVVDAEMREWAHVKAERLRHLKENVVQDTVEMGEILIEVRNRLPHGEWGRWLKAEFEWSQNTANSIINIAETFSGKDLSGTQIGVTSLKILSLPSLPLEVRQEAADMVASRASVSTQDARDFIRRSNPELADRLEEGGVQLRAKKQALVIANELHSAARNMQVALANAYPVPLASPVRRALQKIFDLAIMLEDDEMRRLVVPERLHSKRKPRSKTGYRGLYSDLWHQGAHPYRACLTVTTGGKTTILQLGYYATPEEAARAYDAKVLELFGPNDARLNFPDE